MKQLIMSLVPVGPLLPDIALGHPSSWALLEPFKHSSSTCSKEGPFLSDSKALFSISFVPLALGANGGGGPLGGGVTILLLQAFKALLHFLCPK